MAHDKICKISISYSDKAIEKTVLPINKTMASLQQESVKNKNYRLPLHSKFENQIDVTVKFHSIDADAV